jgi:hypothetical protein
VPADPAPGILEQECDVLSRYLTGSRPTPYLTRKYREGHQAIPFNTEPASDPFDAVLVMFARKSPWLARMADAYARRARPHGMLRQKLTLLLAITENAPPHYRDLTSGSSHGSMSRALLSTTVSLGAFGLALTAGAFMLGPLHLLLSFRTAGRA